MIEAIFKAHEVNQEIIKFIDRIVAECGKEKHSYESCAFRKNCLKRSRRSFLRKRWKKLYSQMTNRKREEHPPDHRALEEAFAENEEWLALLGEAVYQYQKKTVRKMILKDHKRPDGRAHHRSVRWQQRSTSFREYMVLLCSPVDRLRSVPAHWHRFQRHRDLTVLMSLRQQEIYASLQLPVLLCR